MSNKVFLWTLKAQYTIGGFYYHHKTHNEKVCEKWWIKHSKHSGFIWTFLYFRMFLIIFVSCWYQRWCCERPRREGPEDSREITWQTRITHIGKTFYIQQRPENTAGNIFLFQVGNVGNPESYYLKFCPRDQFDIHDFFFEGELSSV